MQALPQVRTHNILQCLLNLCPGLVVNLLHANKQLVSVGGLLVAGGDRTEADGLLGRLGLGLSGG